MARNGFGPGFRAGNRTRRPAAAAVCVAALALLTAGCSDDGGTASDAASRAASAVASATARAGEKIHEVKGGVDAKADVRLGDPSTDDDGRATVKVTADNSADSSKSFAVQVTFKDADGKLLDTVVTKLPDVPAGESKDATARSTRTLDGEVKAHLTTALRY
ncbi:FxLYD domain-containing protein [Streptomyces sp. NPDC050732]|uniref:FxLYD domain-containing protein n=1 Tax=Streptomyces sp. NPDC050732 TaxID=3154632 RepID=UPI003448EA89